MVLCSIFLQEVGPKTVVRAVAQLYGKRTHFRQKKTEKFWFWNSGFLSARIGFVASSVFDFFMLRFFIFSEAKLFKNRSCFLFVFFSGCGVFTCRCRGNSSTPAHALLPSSVVSANPCAGGPADCSSHRRSSRHATVSPLPSNVALPPTRVLAPIDQKPDSKVDF